MNEAIQKDYKASKKDLVRLLIINAVIVIGLTIVYSYDKQNHFLNNLLSQFVK